MKKLPPSTPLPFLSTPGHPARLNPLRSPGNGTLLAPQTAPDGSLLRNTDLSLLHPAFRDQLLALLSRFRDDGLPFVLYEGFRTPARQAYLYSKGRTQPGKVVTQHNQGDSLHQYGLGADLVMIVDGETTWDRTPETSGYWEALEYLVPQYGMKLNEEEGNPGPAHVECTFIELADIKRGLLPSPGADGKDWWDNLQNQSGRIY